MYYALKQAQIEHKKAKEEQKPVCTNFGTDQRASQNRSSARGNFVFLSSIFSV
jgi:hypothetical protein